MSKRPRSNRARPSSQKLLAAVRREQTLGEHAQQFDVYANQIKLWRDQLLKRRSDIFDPGGKSTPPVPKVVIKTLHAKLGEFTLENDFLEGVLTKAGLMSANR